jgi:chemotaxis protein histidine kinase CheA
MPERAEAEPYEIIEARNDLRAKVREVRTRSPEDDPIRRAEAALAVLSRHFDDWMADEVSAMSDRRDSWVAAGMPAGELREAFYRAVHDLKGQASTLGFPLASRVAASLCQLLDHVDPDETPPRALVDGHVDAIRAIFREKAKDETDRVGHELAATLDELTTDYLGEHGLFAPEG